MYNIRQINPKAKYFAFLIILFIIANTVLHIKAGLVYPVPYDDETAFYYPSKAFCENNNFFTESLNSKREVFWMPPVFMVFSGVVFKFTKPSLITGRWIAYSYAALCFLLLSFIIGRHLNFDIPSILILGFCFISRHWIYIGNMMRMETMMLFVTILGFYLVYQRKTLAGISICIFALLIHPNALYFLLFASFYELVIYRANNIKASFTKKQLVIALACFLCVLAYTLTVLPNIQHFVSDWKYQLSTRSMEGLLELLFGLDQVIFSIVLLIAIYFTIKVKSEPLLFLILLAFTLCVARIMGQYYPIFIIMSIALTTIVIYHLSKHYLTHFQISNRSTLAIGIFVVLIAALFVGTIINLPYQNDMRVLAYNEQYHKKSDMGPITKQINASYKSKPYIYFIPVSDGVLLDYAENRKWVHRLNVFDTVRYDGFVIHESKYNDLETALEILKTNYPEFERKELGAPFYVRDSTEKWYLVRNKYSLAAMKD